MTLFAKNLKVLRASSQLKQSKVAEMIGVTPSTWSNYEVGKSEPNLEAIAKISNAFNVSIDDLVCRDLSPLAHTLAANTILNDFDARDKPMRAWYRAPKFVTVDPNGQDNVLYVALNDRVAYHAEYENQEFLQKLPAYRIPFHDGLYRMFEVAGFTMLPFFTEGDILIARFCDNLLDIRDDNAYVLLTRERGLIFKRVTSQLAHKNKLILRNDNPAPADRNAELVDNDDVLEIWAIKAHLNFSLYSPEAMKRELKAYNARLEIIEEKLRNVDLNE